MFKMLHCGKFILITLIGLCVLLLPRFVDHFWKYESEYRLFLLPKLWFISIHKIVNKVVFFVVRATYSQRVQEAFLGGLGPGGGGAGGKCLRHTALKLFMVLK